VSDETRKQTSNLKDTQAGAYFGWEFVMHLYQPSNENRNENLNAMTTTTCKSCLMFTAVLAIRGEQSSQYQCHRCGSTFELDHKPQPFRTQARPQSINLPSIAGTVAVQAAESQAARCRRILSALPRGLVCKASEFEFDYNQATALATRQTAAQEP